MRHRRVQGTSQAPQEVVIQGLTHEGKGVARLSGKAVFVPDTLPGERVSYLPIRRRRDFDEGKLLEVLQPSPQRIIPRCQHFGVCGGCSLQHLDSGAQLEFRQHQLLDSLQRLGKVTPDRVLPPIKGPIWNYRRRARLSVSHVTAAGTHIGFKERSSSDVASLKSCDVLDPVFSGRIPQLLDLINSLEIRQQVFQLEVAVGDHAAGMVLWTSREPGEADRKRLSAFSAATGISIWLHPDAGTLNAVLPDTPELSYQLPGHKIEIRFTPDDFIQINGTVNISAVNQVLELLDPQSSDHVLELFSGLGNFTLPLARKLAQVVAVEGESGLVKRARSNAVLNGLTNIEFQVADLTRPDTASSWLARHFDKVLLDPPRAGAREMIPALAATRPQRIVYVSCHPGTLSRDAGALVNEFGYRLLAAGIMDMFPHTSHVESVALFVTA